MFEDLLSKSKKPKICVGSKCTYCNSTVIVEYDRYKYTTDKTHRTQYGQKFYCMKCDKYWCVTYNKNLKPIKIKHARW